MNTRIFVVVLTACACMTLGSTSARAQGTTCNDHPDGLSEYRTLALELRGTFFLLPSLREIYRGGRPAYGNASEIFAGSPNALGHYRAYQALTVVSGITGVLGLAAAVVGVVIGPPWRSTSHTTASTLLTGGGVLFLFGSFFLRDAAFSRLNDAVNTYNGELALRIL